MENQRKYSQKPLTLSAKAIQDFQKIYFLEYGIQITSKQAQSEGLRFLQSMKHILKPIPVKLERNTYGK